jgi:hypothetical protein
MLFSPRSLRLDRDASRFKKRVSAMPFVSYLYSPTLVLIGRVAGEERARACGDATPASDAPASGGFVV